MNKELYNPKVSIVIPVYNGSNYLKEAIDSALNQTYENVEVIVVNDGSNDNGLTENIAKSYGDKIRYFYKENGGVSSALNYGIQQMSGDYFSWLSHDDGYYKRKIEDSINLLKEVNEIKGNTIAYTGGVFVNSSGEKIRLMKQKLNPKTVYSGIQATNIMLEKGTFNGCCMLIPKNAFNNVGFFNENLRYSQDSLMWYQLFLSGYSIVSDENINVFSRMHREQVTLTRKDLYHHDARYIAEILVEDLVSADKNGNLLYKYIKRITKYNSTNAVDFLYNYSKTYNVLPKSKLFLINVYRSWGRYRYQLSKVYKKIITRG